MKPKPVCGAYVIIHTETRRVYVGSATSIAKRWYWHRERLNKGVHTNHFLQNAWSKYGAQAFEWKILESTDDPNQLFALEQKWIDHYQSYDRAKGFNIAPRAGTTLGIKMDDEFRERCSEIQTGRKRPQQTKDAISVALKGNQNGKGKYYCGHLTETDVLAILIQVINGDLFVDIAPRFRVTDATIARIAKRRIWQNVKLPPELEARLPKSFASRRATGARNRKTKLTEEQVRVIKQRLSNPHRGILSQLAHEFDVTAQSIAAIQRGENWKKIS